MASEDDLYALRNLAEHLAARGDARLQDLLTDFGFLRRKLEAVGAPALIADYEHLASGSPLRHVQAAIRLASSTLEEDPAELAGQLLGRLPVTDALSALSRLVVASRQATGDQYPLRPTSRSLSPAGLHQSLPLSGNSSGLAITDDDRVVTSDGRNLRVWDLAGRQPIRSWSAHPATVTAVAWTRDDRWLVSADARGGIRVWSFASGQLRLSWNGHEGWIQDLAVLPGSRRFVSAGGDLVKLWDLATGTELLKLAGHTGEVMALAVAPDGRTAISGSRDATIRVWDLAVGSARLQITAEHPVFCLALDPKGRYLISGGIGGAAQVWELATGTLVREIPGRGLTVQSVAVSPDGRRIALARTSRVTVEDWSGKERRHLRGVGERLRKVAFCRRGAWLVTATATLGLELWDLQAVPASEERAAAALALAITPDGRQVVIGADDGTVSVRDIEQGRELHRFWGSETWISRLTLSPDGDEVFLGDLQGNIRRFALASGERLAGVTGFEADESIRAMEWSREGRYLVAGQRDIRVWDLLEGGLIAKRRISSGLLTLALIPGTLQAIVCPQQAGPPIRLDLQKGRRRRRLQVNGGTVRSLAVAADGRFAVAGSDDGSLLVWKLADGGVHTWAGHRGRVECLALPADGRYVVSGSTDRTLRVWDLGSGRCLAKFTADNGLRACAVTPDGRTIVACGFGGELHILRWSGQGLAAAPL
jgi:WD40 repeat protein